MGRFGMAWVAVLTAVVLLGSTAVTREGTSATSPPDPSSWKHEVECTGEQHKPAAASAHTGGTSASWAHAGATKTKAKGKSHHVSKPACNWDTTHNRCRPSATEVLPERPAPSQAQNGTWPNKGAKRLLAVLYGQTARPSCSGKARGRQLDAVKSQSRVLATLERRERFSVALLLATNDCGGGWEGQLRAAYFPRLVGLALDNCAKARAGDPAIGRKCLVNRALALLDGYAGGHGFDMVLFMRPDLYFKAKNKMHDTLLINIDALQHLDPGAELVSRLVADRTRLVWPTKCEHGAWDRWWCVSDVMLAVPAGQPLAELRRNCFGHATCIPEAWAANPVDGRGRHFDGAWPTTDPRLIFSGHGCYRCAATKVPSLSSHLGFAWDVERDANARKAAGENPYYSFVEG